MPAKKKPESEKKGSLSATVPNRLLDRISEDMEANGQTNFSGKVAEIIQFWVDVALDGKEPPMRTAVGDDKAIDDDLARFKDFSSSKFV